MDSRCLTVPSGRTILNSIAYFLFWRNASKASWLRSIAIVWVYPLQYTFEVGKALPRIKSPNSVTFLRPVDRPCGVKDNGAGMAQPLCLGQISFAASSASSALFRSVMYRPTPR